MMKIGEIVKASVILCGLLAVLSACQKPEGPAERAGKDLDNAVQKTGQQIEKAGDSIQDAAKGNNK